MKINKLPDLFEINFKKARYQELLSFFKLCLKYHTRLFDDEFFNINLSTPDKFLRFVNAFRDSIYCVTLGKNPSLAAFFYLYDTKKAIEGTLDAKVTFCVSRPYWGFGSYAIAKRGLRFLFEELKVRKLTAEIVGENTLASSLLKRLGFELEAILYKECFKAGKVKDLYIFSKFNPAIKV